MDELPLALKIADQILDRPNGDPDRDVAVLARQFLRLVTATANIETMPADALRAWVDSIDDAIEASGVKGLLP